MEEDPPRWTQVLIAVLGELVFAVVAIPLYVFLVLPRHPEGGLPGIVPPVSPDVDPAFAVLLTLAAFALPMALFLVLNRLFGDNLFSNADAVQLAKDYSMPELALVYLAAGIGEELLFRGALVEPCGVVVAALIFTAAHFAYWSKPLVLAYTFAIGIVWGVFYVQVGSLALCVLVHALYNLVITGYLKIKAQPNEA